MKQIRRQAQSHGKCLVHTCRSCQRLCGIGMNCELLFEPARFRGGLDRPKGITPGPETVIRICVEAALPAEVFSPDSEDFPGFAGQRTA